MSRPLSPLVALTTLPIRWLNDIGEYLLMLKRLFEQRERARVYWDETMREAVSMGIGSVLIVVVISVFVGAVSTQQTVYQLIGSFVPLTTVGSIVSASAMLEFAPTITSLVLAGKIGSNVSSQIGTMRVSEQIDALDVMGINSASFLILPKIIAGAVMFPLLVIISCFLMHVGGIWAGVATNEVSYEQFSIGAQGNFTYFQIYFMLTKAFTYGLLVTSIGSYQGYYVQGGAIEVGEASTRAVVYSCIMILLADFVLATILL